MGKFNKLYENLMTEGKGLQDLALDDAEKQLIAQFVNKFASVGPHVDLDSFKYLTMKPADIAKILKKHSSNLDDKGKALADKIIKKLK